MKTQTNTLATNNKMKGTSAIDSGLERKAFRIDQACAVLGVGRSSIYALMRDGRLGFVRLTGGQRRIPSSAIDAFIERNLIAAR